MKRKNKEIVPDFHLDNNSSYEDFVLFVSKYGKEMAKAEFPRFRDTFGQWKLYGELWFESRLHYGKAVDVFIEKAKEVNKLFLETMENTHDIKTNSKGQAGAIRLYSDGSNGYNFIEYANILDNITFSMENIGEISMLMYYGCFPRVDMFNLEKALGKIYRDLVVRPFEPYWEGFDRVAYEKENEEAWNWLRNHSLQELLVELCGEGVTKIVEELCFYDYKEKKND
jgi:hypothetical protein